jgi:hypothetical protein
MKIIDLLESVSTGAATSTASIATAVKGGKGKTLKRNTPSDNALDGDSLFGEGSKVDRQAGHITRSMMKSHPGMSKDEAEAAAWAHIKHPKKKKKKTTEDSVEEHKKGVRAVKHTVKPRNPTMAGDKPGRGTIVHKNPKNTIPRKEKHKNKAEV